MTSFAPLTTTDTVTPCGLPASTATTERHIANLHATAVRHFRCAICGATFGRKGVWKKHVQMVHEGQRKFECDVEGCNLSFGLKSDLKRHTQSVHLKQRPFECHVCGASFGRKSDLKRHTQSLHPAALEASGFGSRSSRGGDPPRPEPPK